MEAIPGIQQYQSLIATELRSILAGRELPLYDMLRYHLGWTNAAGEPVEASSGKGLRPLLCLLTCAAVGGRAETAVPAAAALELLHNFTLIHDDIQDASPERRHRATVWHIWGTPQAITAGDAMYGLSRLALLRLEKSGVNPTKVLRAAELMDNACLRICEGQYMDVAFEESLEVGVPSYLDMIGFKSASLIQCAMETGAVLGTEEESVVGAMARCGRNLGMAFQIQDDILGIWGREAITGKPSESDVLKRKKTLPVVYTLNSVLGSERDELLRIYMKEGGPSTEDAAAVPAILDRVGAREYAENMARDFCHRALDEMMSVPLVDGARESLTSLANFLIAREY
ncbi:MAG: hypothetical protein HW403_953 [Dehalococcoidia bacterium]|nr:hypothetical protein [Dehalococcoidia bacterium]